MSTLLMELDHCFEKDGKYRAYCVTPWRDTAEERNNDIRDIQSLCSRLDAAEKEAKGSYQHAEAEAHAHDECRKELESFQTRVVIAETGSDELLKALGKSLEENQDLRVKLAQSKEANEELVKDRKRLDRLSCQYQVIAYSDPVVTNLHWWNQDPCNLRQAIDAMKGTP